MDQPEDVDETAGLICSARYASLDRVDICTSFGRLRWSLIVYPAILEPKWDPGNALYNFHYYHDD